MSKILLVAINAKYIHSNPALHMMKAYAGRKEVEIAEYTINNLFEDVLADIYIRKPEVVAFSCYIWNWEMIGRLIVELPKVLPETDIWVGGPEVTYDADDLLIKYPELTGVMVGEGEQTFKELAEHYIAKDAKEKMTNDSSQDSGMFDIKGLCVKKTINEYGVESKKFEPYFTGTREPINMDDIPFYYGDLTDFENRIIYYESSRGCPFCCSYCLSSIGEKVRFRSLELVKKELQFFLDHKVPQVKFIDRTFNCNHKHACGIWEYIIEHDNGITNFHFEISADLLNEMEIDILKKMRPGLIQLEIGVQSTNDSTIHEIKRTMNLEKLKGVVARIHEFGNIHQHLDLIVGLPGEDIHSFIESFNDVYAMSPDQLQLGFLKVLKGSYMETQVENYGLRYQSAAPYEVLSTKWISFDEVLTLKRVEEMVEQYYNSGQFKHSIPFVVSRFKTPYDFFCKLAQYYSDNGYYTNKPARLYKYQVLLAFANQYMEEEIEIVKELLTFDLYLREKCKSRPDFARDLTPYKSEIYAWELTKKEHVDIFYYPVWEKNNITPISKLDSPVMVGFDYDNRDPLDHNATIRISNY